MCYIETAEYSIRLDNRGLIDLRTPWGGQLIDRGGLNEWIDISQGVPGDQAHRDKIHWLQIGEAASVTKSDPATLICEGMLAKAGGPYGGMIYRNEMICRDRWILMKVWRKYIASSSFGADDSLCFLAPPSRTWSFHAGGGESYDVVDEETQKWVPIDDPHVEIPTRLRACCQRTGWAAMLGSRGGLGVILLKYSPGTGGILRATRPRFKAEIKFDEIEFQFVPGGPRRDGDVQTGTFVLVPARSWEEVADLHDQMVSGKLTP